MSNTLPSELDSIQPSFGLPAFPKKEQPVFTDSAVPFQSDFLAASQRYGVPVNVIMGLAEQESSFNPQALGVPTAYGRAKGIMQYIDSTASRMGINPYDPVQSIDAAAKQLRERLDKGYSMEEAVKAHFAGDDRKQWGPKTAAYGQEVLARAEKFMSGNYTAPAQTVAEISAAPEATQGQMAAPAFDTQAIFAELNKEEPDRYRPLTEEEMKRVSQHLTPELQQDALSKSVPGVPIEINIPDLASPGETVTVQGEQPKGNEDGNLLTDAGLLLASGLNNTAKNLRELVGKIPGVGKTIVEASDRADQWLNGKSTEEIFKSWDKTVEEGLTPEMLAARKKAFVIEPGDKLADGKEATGYNFGPAWSDPRTYMSGIVESLPEMAVTMGGAGRLAQMSYKAAIKKGLSKEAAAKAAARTATVAGGILEGSLAGAQTSRSVRDQILAMDENQLKDSEAMKALMSDGKTSFDDAKAILADDAASQAFWLAGVSTGVFGGLGDRTLAKIITGDGWIVKSAVKGAIGEGVLEELPQSVAQQVAENKAMQEADPNISLAKGVPNAAASGLAIGGLMGAGLGAVAPRAGEEKPAERIEPTIQADPAPKGPLSSAVDEGVQASADAMAKQPKSEAAPAADEFMGPVGGETLVVPADDPNEKFNAKVVAYRNGNAVVEDANGERYELSPTEVIRPDAQPVKEAEQPAAEPVQTPEPLKAADKPLDQMNEQELRDRLKYVNSMGKQNGWDKRLTTERKIISSAIDSLRAAPQSEEQPADQPVKWFGSAEKANVFIQKKNLAATHEVVPVGNSRFEVREKPADKTKSPHFQRSTKLVGPEGAVLSPSMDIGFAKAGGKYVVEQIDKDGTVHLGDQATNALIKLTRQEIERIRPNGIKWDSVETSVAETPKAKPEQQQPANQSADDNSAKNKTVSTPAGRDIEVEYKVVDADSLVASNLPDGRVNPDYPAELQPRDRTRPASIDQVNRIASSLNPRLLGESPTTSDGAPIISGSGVVESGNGRTIAIKQAYRNGGASEYRQWLVDNGYDVEGIAAPVLVRVRKSDLSPEELQAYTKESNQRTTLEMSATEQSRSDAGKLADIIQYYAGGDVAAASNRDFVRKFVASVIGTAERGSMMDDNGLLSQAGRRRIEAALLMAAYGDQSIVSEVFESMDTDIKAIGGALLDASGKWAQMRQASTDEAIAEGLDVTPNLIEAVNLIRRARAEGRSVSELAKTADMFSGVIDPMTESFLRIFYRGDSMNRARGRDKVAEALTHYADSALASQPGAGLFGDNVDSGLILGAVDERLRGQEGQASQQNNLFTASTSNDGGQSAATSREGQRSQPEARSQSPEEPSQTKLEKPAANQKDRWSRKKGIADRLGNPSKGDKISFSIPVGSYTDANQDYEVISIDNEGAYLKSDNGSTQVSRSELAIAKNKGLVVTVKKPSSEQAAQQPAAAAAPEADTAARSAVTENKIFTEDAAEKARQLLRSKLSQLNSGIDPEIMQAGITLAGYHIEKGARTFSAFAQAMIADLGDMVRPYLKSWYMGVKYDPRATGFEGMSSAADVEAADINSIKAETNEPDTAGSVEQDSAIPDNAMGEGLSAADRSDKLRNDERSTTERLEKGRAGRGSRSSVSAVGTADAGTQADQSVAEQDGQSVDAPGVTGASDSRGNSKSSNRGIRAERQSDKRVREKAESRELQLNERGTLQAAADAVPVVTANDQNIRETLPLLSAPQQDDVIKAEKRLLTQGKKGMMFTNGTGTGKTYTALGIIKRTLRRGGSVLVVSPAGVTPAWAKGAKDILIDEVHTLSSKTDSGKPGLNLTSFQNFRDNQELLKRNFDLVVYDESHHLMASMGGDETTANAAHKALTGHPDYVNVRGHMAMKSEFDAYTADADAAVQKLVAKGMEFTAANRQVYGSPTFKTRYDKLNAAADKLSKQLAKEKVDTKVVFLSASPFSGHKSVFYADGYLFDSKVGAKESQAYNTGSAEAQFLVNNFGYRMRYNRVTQPGAEVDVALLERDWADRMFAEGSMSGRTLELENDYSREFAVVAPGIGKAIDDAFKIIDWKNYPKLHEQIRLWRKGGADRQLTEALRARAALQRIQQHLDMGRKVVVFHERQTINLTNPFDFKADDAETVAEINRLKAEHPEIFKIDLSGLQPAPTVIGNQFGDLVGYFSGQNKSTRDKDLSDFNNDDGTKRILVIQKDAGKEGLSAHDITGKYQRALMILNTPVSPADAIQMEGRVYRHGLKSDAVIEYPTIQTSFEKTQYRDTVSSRTSTAENLAMGSQARSLREAFREGYLDPATDAPNSKQGKGGRTSDRAGNGMTMFDRAKTYYFRRAKKTSKTKAQEGADYFATPEPLGFKMVEWAGLLPGEKVLEPSAGHGAIARWFPESVDGMAIEQSSNLSGELGISTGAEVRTMDFEDFNTINKFNAVVMNPPFGVGGSTAIKHIEKAVKHLRDGGRIIAIYPNGPAADKKFNDWYEGATGVYVTATINLPTATFERAGTSVSTRILIIDKNTKGTMNRAPVNIDLSNLENINELFDRIKSIEVPERPNIFATAREAGLNESDITKLDKTVYRAALSEFTSGGKAKQVGKKELKKLAEKFGAEVSKSDASYWDESFYDFETKADRDRFYTAVVDKADELKNPQQDEPVRYSSEQISSTPSQGMPLAKVQAIANKIVSEFTGDMPLRMIITQTQDELYGPAATEQGIYIKGAYHPERNAFTLIADNLDNPRDVRKTIIHEFIAHYGLDTFDAESRKELLQKVIDSRGIKEKPGALYDMWEKISTDPFYGQKSEIIQAEEVFAHTAESTEGKFQQFFDSIRGLIIRALRKLGLIKSPLTNTEIRQVIRSIAQGIKNGTRTKQSQFDEVKFSQAPQIGTEAFKRWFGDSKVVDESGKPLVVYHGTSSEFSEFNNTENGMFFSDNKETARRYGEREPMAVYLSMQKPLEINAGFSFWNELDYVNDKNLNELQSISSRKIKTLDHLKSAAVAAGYDGVIVKNVADNSGVGTQYIAFSPEQIKSATGNDGTFDPTNPDIRFSQRPTNKEVDSWLDRQWEATKELTGDALTAILPKLLHLTPGRVLLTRVGKDIPALAHYADIKLKMDTFRDDWHAITDKLAQRWQKYRVLNSKENSELMDVMHESTLRQADPSDDFVSILTPMDRKVLKEHKPGSEAWDAANERANTDATRQSSYNTLKQRFDKLSPEAQAIYREVRDIYQKLADTQEQIILDNIEKAMGYKVREAQRKHEEELQRIKDEGLKGKERNDAIEKADKALANASRMDAWNKRAKLNQLRSEFESNRLAGPYFPLSRFGDFFVTARDKKTGEVEFFSRQESARDQTRVAKELKAQGYDVETGFISKSADLRKQIPAEFVANIEELLKGIPGTEETQDQVWQMFLERMPDISIRKNRIHRKGRAGFEEDALRAFASHMFHGAHQTAKLKYSMALEDQLDEAKRQVKNTRNPTRSGMVLEQANKSHQYVMNPTSNAISQIATQGAFIWYLAQSPAAALLNMAQTVIVGPPKLAAFYDKGTVQGMAMAIGQINRALFDLANGKTFAENSPRVTPEEKAAVAHAYRVGLITRTQSHDVAGIADSGIKYSPIRAKIMAGISWMFHHTERVNREATFLAAYRVAKKKGLQGDNAIHKAMGLTWDIHYDYQNTSRPAIMHSNTGKALLVFRNYSLNMISDLAYTAYEIINPRNAQERREARTQMIGLLGTLAFNAGIRGLPLYGMLIFIASKFSDEGEDPEVELKKTLLEYLPPSMVGIMMDGVPGYTLGVEISSRIGFGDLWFRTDDRDKEGDSEFLSWVLELLGASASIPYNIYKGIAQINEGYTWRGLENILFKMIKDPMKAWRYSQEGVTTKNGDPIVDEVGGWDIFKQAMGVTPARIAEQHKMNNYNMNKQHRILTQQNKLLSDFYKAWKEKDSNKQKAALAKMNEFSAKYPEMAIDSDAIRQSLKRRERYRGQNVGGMNYNQKLLPRLQSEQPEATYK